MRWSPAQDPESGIQYYEYAIGTGPGLYDVVGWTVTEHLTATLQGIPLVLSLLRKKSVSGSSPECGF